MAGARTDELNKYRNAGYTAAAEFDCPNLVFNDWIAKTQIDA
jgi:hypothetical protein